MGYLKKDAGPVMHAPHGGTVQSSVASVRDDVSNAASPAPSSGTWNSPSAYSGVSPVNPQMQYHHQHQQYMDANQAAYGSQGGSAPVTPGGMRAVSGPAQMGSGAHRRGASEMSGGGGGDGSAAKRQRQQQGWNGNGVQMAAPMRQ